MYEAYFELREPAFSIAVDPRYLFMSQQHKEALAHLLYGVSGGGFVMLTGEVGTGKTTIIRCLLEQLPEQTDIAFILNPKSDRLELLSTICDELGIGIPQKNLGIKDLTDSLSHYLLKNHERGRRTILLIDEAQLLPMDTLEQIRLLTNLETTTQKLLHIMLVGQPELKEIVGKPELRQLSQRITARFHLHPLSLPETEAYIKHRLKVAGLPEGRSPFAYPIIKRIHKLSGGIPRLINVLCERCLLGVYAKQTREVTSDILKSAASEILGDERPSIKIKPSVYWGGFATLLVALLTLVLSKFTPPLVNAKLNKASVTSSSQAHVSSNASSSSSKASVLSLAFANYAEAENVFLLWQGYPLATDNRPCAATNDSRVSCEKLKINSWRDLQELNRPAILVLNTPDKFSRYAVLVGIKNTQGLLINDSQQTETINLSELGQHWTGEIFYLWTTPPGFENTLTLGDSGPTVEWVSQQFAKLDKQKNPLADDLLSLALQERIKIFQRTQGINITGNIDKPTLQKLNLKLKIDKALTTAF